MGLERRRKVEDVMCVGFRKRGRGSSEACADKAQHVSILFILIAAKSPFGHNHTI